MGEQRWDAIPADAFVEILQRLPPCPRRRLRLVCRHWRNVIDDREPRPQARAKVLAVVGENDYPRAYVLDDLITGLAEETTAGRDLKLRECGAVEFGTRMVGTCNGLLCLRRAGQGDVVVVNPATGEKLAVPPPTKKRPSRDIIAGSAAYSFSYHPATGLYKVVHVPCRGDGGAFDVVNVFTLGDRSWRQVPVPAGTSCLLSFGLVSVGGATYWVARDNRSLMSFDLEADERVVFVETLPVRVGPKLSSHLTTDISGRLGLTVCSYKFKWRKVVGRRIQVWMLVDGGGNKKGSSWVLRHNTIAVERGSKRPLEEIACWPLVTHGEHVLTTPGRGHNWVNLHAHRPSETTTRGGVVRMEGTPGSAGMSGNSLSFRTFAYVETLEPLALYAGDEGNVDDKEWYWMFDSGEEGPWKLRLLSPWWVVAIN